MIVKKIDIHSHPNDERWMLRPNGTTYPLPEELFKIYDELGVEAGVAQPLLSPEYTNSIISNKDAYRMASNNSRLYWFANIDPRSGQYDPEYDFSHRIEYYKEHGAKGLGELTAALPFDHELYLNLFKYAEKYDMPVIFHMGDGKYHDYGIVDEIGLPRLEKVLGMFPNLIFIGHSQKFWAEIGDDVTEENRNEYPTGKVNPGRVPYLMEKYPNLHCDLSAGSGANAMMRDPEYAVEFMEKFSDRLYFGCDITSPCENPREVYKLSAFLDDLVESGKLSQEAYNKICRENALKILNK